MGKLLFFAVFGVMAYSIFGELLETVISGRKYVWQ
jgi:hypothetical protein